MKTLKHTKAPWKVSEVRTLNEFGTQGIDITSHNYRDFATVWNMEGMEEENEANAKLIAAAPEMLEVLQDAMEWFKWNNGEIDLEAVPASAEHILGVMREIIEKATK